MDNWIPLVTVNVAILIFMFALYRSQKKGFEEQRELDQEKFDIRMIEQQEHAKNLVKENKVLRHENSRLRRKLGEAAMDDDVFPSRQQTGLKFTQRGGNEDESEEGGNMV